MTPSERNTALKLMNDTIHRFYCSAIQIGNHPFIEFAGVMTAYLKSCQRAHDAGIDFTECNRHTGQPLPMEGFEVLYLNEKLDCIFDGRITASERSAPSQENLKAELAKLSQQPQRQDAANDQLLDLHAFANKLGLYDAADCIKSIVTKESTTCHAP